MANNGSLEFGIRLTADGSAMVGTVKIAKGALDDLKGSAAGAGNAVEKLGAQGSVAGDFLRGLAGAVSVAAITAWANSVVAAAAQLKDLSTITGSTVEDLSRLSNIAIISGQGTDLLKLGLERLSYSMNSADLEATRAQKALTELGITAKDPARAMQELADKLSKYADGTAKAAIVQDIMGRGAQNLLPLLAKMAEAHGINATVTAKQAEEAERFEQGLRRLSVESVTFRNALLDNIGALADFIERLREGTQAAGGFWAFLTSGASLADSANTAGQIAKIKGQLGELEETRAALSKNSFFSFFNADDILIVDAQVKTLTADLQRLQALQNVNPGRSLNLPPGGDPALDFTRPTLPYKSSPLGGASQESTLASYYAYLQQQEAAAANSAKNILGIQLDGYKRQLDALNNYHVLGLISEQDFVDRSLDVARREAQARLDEQKALVSALLNQLSDVYDKAVTTPKEVQDRETKLLELANAYTKAKYDAGRAEQALADVETRHAQDTAVAQQKSLDAITAINRASADYVKTLSDQSADLAFQASLLGKSQVEQEVLNAQRQIELRLRDELLKIDRQIEDLKGNDPAQVAALRAEQERLTVATAATGEQIKANTIALDEQRDHEQALTDLIRSAGDRGAQFITDFVTKGSSAFKSLWADFTRWALESFAKIVAQKVIINIAGSVGLTGTATNAFAGSNPIGTLLNGASGGGGFLSDLLGGGAGAIAGPTGETGAALTAAFGGATEAATGFAALGASLGTMIPYVGLAVAAIGLLSSAFKSAPSPTKGQFGVSAGTSGFEDNAFTASKFGNLGFLDANTQQFSGEAAQILNKIVAGALDAFAGRMSEEQQARLADILQHTTFATNEGTFTTQDFLQKYGGAVLQQVVTAAFDVLDPAFGSVIANFKGTADEVSKMTNTLLAVYDASKDFDAAFRANVVAALGDGTQATADKVLAFVAVVATFGTAIDGLGPKLEALDPASITAFVDALGGAAKLASSFGYLGQNFLTTAERLTQSTNTLTSDFENLGISAIPKTHAEFLALLDSFDLTTEAGRTMYASVLGLSSLFVAVHGTADQAAGSVNALADATTNLASATDFFNSNFYSAAEQQAKKAAAAASELAAASATLGISIPTSVEGFRALIEGIDTSTEAGKALYAALIVLAPAVYDLSGAAAAATTNVTNLANSITQGNVGDILQNQVDEFVQQAAALADQMANADVGGKLALQINLIGQRIAEITTRIAYYQGIGDTRSADQLTTQLQSYESVNDGLTKSLARFTVLSAQYDAARAGQLVDLEKWYRDEQDALKNNLPALAALAVIFQDKWAAIINGTSGATEALDDFIKKIQQLAGAAGGNAGQEARLELALTKPKLDQLQTQYASLSLNDALAPALLGQINTIKDYNKGLAEQIAHFTVYTAQYGQQGANQLIALERQRAEQQQTFAGNADALAILDEIFADRFKSIVDGLSTGVDGTLDQLARLKQGIADYLKGLQVGNLSPLTPQEQLTQAKAALDSEFKLAQGGDQKALGDVSRFEDTYLKLARDAFASSQTFTDIFNEETKRLGDLAGVLPTGESPQISIDKTFAGLNAVLPSGSTIVSKADLEAQTAIFVKAFLDGLSANADVTEQGAQAVKTAVAQQQTAITDALRPLR